MLYYYGRELIAHGRYEEGLRAWSSFWIGRKDGLENKIDATRQMALCYYRMGNDKQAFNALVSGFLYDVPRGETCCDLGRHFLDRGEYEKAAYWYHRALEGKKDPKSGAFIQRNVTDSCRQSPCAYVTTEWEKGKKRNSITNWQDIINPIRNIICKIRSISRRSRVRRWKKYRHNFFLMRAKFKICHILVGKI